MLLYTGAPRQSGINNWEVFKQHINGDKHVIRNFAEISRIAQEMHVALKNARWADVERLLNEEWKLRRTNAPGITTPLIDKLIAAARKHGARAAKVCGAGGGGCVIVLIEEGTRERVQEAIRRNGGQVLDFRIASERSAFHARQISQFRPDEHVYRQRGSALYPHGRSCSPPCCAWFGVSDLVAILPARLPGVHVLRFEAIFRSCLAALAARWIQLASSRWQPRGGASNCRAGLALAPGWLRQFGSGCGLGFVLVVIAVIAVALFGTAHVPCQR